MQLSTIIHEAKYLIILALLIWQRSQIIDFIYLMLGEPGKDRSISSRRVIATSATAVLLYIIIYVVTKTGPTEPKTIESTILWVLFALIAVSMGFASVPQLFELLSRLKGIVNKAQEEEPTKITTTTETKIEQP